MESFGEIQTYTLETCACLLIVVCAWKLYRMKVSSLSKCCEGRWVVATSNSGGSSRNLELPSLSEVRSDARKSSEEMPSAVI